MKYKVTRVETRTAGKGKVIESVSEVKTSSKNVDTLHGVKAGFKAGFIILGAIIFILVAVNFVRSANNSSSVTFSGFLEYISHAPNMRINFNINSLHINGEWVILDGVRQFLNTLGSVVGVVVYAASCVINSVVYLAYYITYLFA